MPTLLSTYHWVTAREVSRVERSTITMPSTDWEEENMPVSFFTVISSVLFNSSAGLTGYSNLKQCSMVQCGDQPQG